ncbi:MAG: hypothetical protein AAF968_00085 [Pseudomonadota bacterium]
MTEQIVLPTSVRGYVRKLQSQVQVLSERVAKLANQLSTRNRNGTNRCVPVIGVSVISISRPVRLADRNAAEWSNGGGVNHPGPEAV